MGDILLNKNTKDMEKTALVEKLINSRNENVVYRDKGVISQVYQNNLDEEEMSTDNFTNNEKIEYVDKEVVLQQYQNNSNGQEIDVNDILDIQKELNEQIQIINTLKNQKILLADYLNDTNISDLDSEQIQVNESRGYLRGKSLKVVEKITNNENEVSFLKQNVPKVQKNGSVDIHQIE